MQISGINTINSNQRQQSFKAVYKFFTQPGHERFLLQGFQDDITLRSHLSMAIRKKELGVGAEEYNFMCGIFPYKDELYAITGENYHQMQRLMRKADENFVIDAAVDAKNKCAQAAFTGKNISMLVAAVFEELLKTINETDIKHFFVFFVSR